MYVRTGNRSRAGRRALGCCGRGLGDTWIHDSSTGQWYNLDTGEYSSAPPPPSAPDVITLQPNVTPPALPTASNTGLIAALTQSLAASASKVKPTYGGPSQISQGGVTYNVVTNPTTGQLQLQLPALSRTAFNVGGVSVTTGALLLGGGSLALLAFIRSRKKGR